MPTLFVRKSSDFQTGESFGFWDLRTAGLGLYRSMAKHSFDDALRFYDSMLIGKTKVSRRGSIWTLTAINPGRTPEHSQLTTVILDEAKGYTISKVTGAGTENKGMPDEKQVLRFTCESNWSKVDSVWVPVSEKATDGDGKELYRMTYKWLSVNKPLDPKILHYKSFPLPKDTPVWDFSKGREGRLIEGRDSDTLPP